MEQKVEKLNIFSILEGKKVEEKVTKLKDVSKAGTWLGDELIIRTYPLSNFVDRIAQVGYDFSGNKKMDTKLRKMLPDIIKADRNFGRSIIDIMADNETTESEKADLIDSNVDDFIDAHLEELTAFNQYRR